VVALSRRRFLGAAGALAAGLIAGCGRTEAEREPAPDADVLAGLPRPAAGADPAERQRALNAYVAALPLLADAEHRVEVMRMAAGQAREIAATRVADGTEPVRDAFAGFTEPSP
jgi:hypothetical protein